MRCPNCGNENPPDYVFCDECGARLIDAPGADAPDDTSTQDADANANASATPVSDGVDSVASASIASATDSGTSNAASAPGSMVITPLASMASRGAATPAATEEPLPASNDSATVQENADMPVTEDTMAATAVDENNAGIDSSTESGHAEGMPDVVPIGSDASGSTVEEATSNPADISPAASGTPATTGDDGAGSAWAATALDHLGQAQESMAKGDFTGYGQSLNDLRSLLESVAQGAPSAQLPAQDMSFAQATAHSTSDNTQGVPATDMTPVTDETPLSGAMAESQSASAVPMVEPAAEAGTLSSVEMTPDTESPAVPATASAADSGGADSMVARLVVISTGAELPIPDQEEITVGREDPSSGIFPDVDLTPYGGEEGGVSRRHARMLHIGDDYFVEDLQSTNFTKLDGQRLPTHAREKIEDGARIDFGRVAVIFRRS